jgi:hypothetical protein
MGVCHGKFIKKLIIFLLKFHQMMNFFKIGENLVFIEFLGQEISFSKDHQFFY